MKQIGYTLYANKNTLTETLANYQHNLDLELRQLIVIAVLAWDKSIYYPKKSSYFAAPL